MGRLEATPGLGMTQTPIVVSPSETVSETSSETASPSFRCIIYSDESVPKPLSRSQNLRGIRSWVSSHLVDGVRIVPVPDPENGCPAWAGRLYVWGPGWTFSTGFACWEVLKGFVAAWRNVHGAPLFIGEEPAGTVSAKNQALAGTVRFPPNVTPSGVA